MIPKPHTAYPFNTAADEAAISRMYGGIHYRAAVEVGVGQGRQIGALLNSKIKMKNNSNIVQN